MCVCSSFKAPPVSFSHSETANETWKSIVPYVFVVYTAHTRACVCDVTAVSSSVSLLLLPHCTKIVAVCRKCKDEEGR